LTAFIINQNPNLCEKSIIMDAGYLAIQIVFRCYV